MRIAIISDIHGNNIALGAVLNDIQSQGGADAIWILGDLAAIGHAPVDTLERLANLSSVVIIKGNTDRFLATGTQPGPTPEQAVSNPDLMKTYTEVTRTFSWTQGALASGGWLQWLAALPNSMRETLLDGTRVLLEHASPGHDDGPALYPNLTETQLRQRFTGHNADLIFVAHTHWAMEARVDGVHVVNAGSVSNVFPPDLRAVWVCLDSDANGYHVTYHRTSYDHKAVIDALERLRHPGRKFIIGFMRGEHEPGWRRH